MKSLIIELFREERQKMTLKTNFNLILAVTFICIFCNTIKAFMVSIAPAPINRLSSNTNSYIKENPNDANGYYILGRIHYLAFANQQVSALKEGDANSLPEIAKDYYQINWDDEMREFQALIISRRELGSPTSAQHKQKIKELEEQGWKPEPKLNHEERIQHSAEAIKNFQKAINMDPNNSLYNLGLASLLEQYCDYIQEIKIKEVTEEIRNIILSKARDIYYKAYKLSLDADLKSVKHTQDGWHGVISYEAGNAYIRLISKQESISNSQEAIILEMQKNIEKVKKQHMPIVTPIVFSFEKDISPTKLLEPDLQVNFDLDGDGNIEVWPWVKPTTGILVWNEDGKGEITSGRQMFGSVTWWLFFNDGYHALDCLDDNRDGALTGNELKGISVWFDVNSNGQSEPAEIKSLDELEIVSISVKSTGTENGWPANKTGIKLKNGQTIASYDWIAQPVDSNVKTCIDVRILDIGGVSTSFNFLGQHRN
jgi:tetratricopeptide (TPR) repeat protein